MHVGAHVSTGTCGGQKIKWAVSSGDCQPVLTRGLLLTCNSPRRMVWRASQAPSVSLVSASLVLGLQTLPTTSGFLELWIRGVDLWSSCSQGYRLSYRPSLIFYF